MRNAEFGMGNGECGLNGKAQSAKGIAIVLYSTLCAMRHALCLPIYGLLM